MMEKPLVSALLVAYVLAPIVGAWAHAHVHHSQHVPGNVSVMQNSSSTGTMVGSTSTLVWYSLEPSVEVRFHVTTAAGATIETLRSDDTRGAEIR